VSGKQTVLFVNHREVSCGIYQYGRRLARILEKSELYEVEYSEVRSRKEMGGVLSLSGFSAVIYNYSVLTMPWLDRWVLHTRPDLVHLALYHEGGLPWGKTAFGGLQQKALPANAWLLVVDSTHVDTADALAVPRPLLDPPNRWVTPDGRPTISSFGFGLPGKGFARLVQLVNEEFDEALVRLHITTSEVCDSTGAQAAEAIRACQEVPRKPDVDLEVTTHFMTDEELMVWLAESLLCAFLYEDPKPGVWRGLSSVLDYALAANVPIAVSRSPMFRHVARAEPSVCIEDRTLKGVMESGAAVLDVYRERWSHGNLIKRYEEVISTCLAGLGEPAPRGSSGTRAMPVNCFLKSQAEIVSATTTLQARGAPTNIVCPPKNWDLLASLSHVSGRVLDLGSGTDGSFFLKVCHHLGLGRERWGIDIEASPPVEGSQIIVGDLMHTPFRDAYFQTLVCLSVVEHGVDDHVFAAECARLLSPGGKLVVSFDAWEPKVDTSQRTIYGLPWKVFGREDIETFVSTLATYDLRLTSPVDWALGDAVIYPGYFSPFNGVQYTFCVLVLEKGEP